ncbi:hypothetical protein [uncultured Bosea sp.]|uniref:hypothetical protein n=1 Tax=uncultured Bosea sp. TaxID=211457 RepID=UPI0025DABC6A|nr:hypothetical protein [uncultured Bosea sp.]
MSVPADGEARRRSGRKAFWLTFAGVLAGGLILANAHLVYVAVGSQPACVPHAKSAGEAGGFRAARPSC